MSTLSRSLNSMPSSRSVRRRTRDGAVVSGTFRTWPFLGLGRETASLRATRIGWRSRTRSISAHGGRVRPQSARHARYRAIIAQRLAGEIGHHAAGFVHQKVGRRKVPVVAAAGEGGIELACATRASRSASECTLGWARMSGVKAGEPVEIALGAGEPGAVERRRRGLPRWRAVERRALRRGSRGTSRRSPAQRARPAPAGRPRPAPPRSTSRRGRRYRRGCRRSDRRSRRGGTARPGRSSSLSSDSQPAPGASALSRARSRSLTAMSASLTGESSSPLVQRLSGPRDGRARKLAGLAHHGFERAARRRRRDHCPATVRPSSRTRRRIGAVAEFEIVGRRQRAEHVEQMAGDGDLAHRIGALAVLDPEAGGAAAVVAGHHVDAHADQVGDVEAVGDVGDQLLGARACPASRCRLVGARRRRRGHAALGVAGGDEAELARGRAVEQPGAQHAVLDQRQLLAGDALAVERARAQAALAQRIVDDADAGGEQLLAELVLQEAGLARDRGAVDGAGEMRRPASRRRADRTPPAPCGSRPCAD